jgi:hypothetical protein
MKSAFLHTDDEMVKGLTPSNRSRRFLTLVQTRDISAIHLAARLLPV